MLSILLGARSASAKNGKRLISRVVDVDRQLEQTHLRQCTRPARSELPRRSAGERRSRKAIRSEQAARPSPSVRRVPIKGGLLLLDQASNCLFAYNDTARHVWDLIEAGSGEESLIAEFARAWEIPLSLARADVNAILTEWRGQNLLFNQGRGAVPGSGHCWRAVPRGAKHQKPAGIPSGFARSAKQPISFAVETELLGPYRLLFAHLETPNAIPQARIEIRTGPSGERVLVEDARERLRTFDPAEVIGALYVAVLERTRPNLQWFALIHGSALSFGGKGLALAGPSGSGKSTLAAGLIAHGYDFLADDVVAISEPDGTIVPWPLPLSIKQGSIDIVRAHHPELAKAAPYRTKNMEARMLVPPASAWDADPVQLQSLSFSAFCRRRRASSAPVCPLSRRLNGC